MIIRFLFLLLLFLGVHSDDCSSNTVQLFAKKVSTTNANDETWSIWSSEGELFYTSTAQTNNRTVVYTLCLPRTSDLKYVLKLEDRVDKWSYGSYLYLYGPYEKYILKASLSTFFEATFSFFLNDIINPTTYWYFSSSPVPDTWKTTIDPAFVTKDPSTPISSYGPHYFCQQFALNPSHFSAFEFQFAYKEGIRVYLNGEVLFSDHLPDGEIDSSTLATKTYQSQVYKTISFSSSIVFNGNNVIAYEIHHLSYKTTTISIYNSLYGIPIPSASELESNSYSVSNCIQRAEVESVTLVPQTSYRTPLEYLTNDNPFQYWEGTKATTSVFLYFTFSKPLMLSAYQLVAGGYDANSYVTQWKLWGLSSNHVSTLLDLRNEQALAFQKRGDHHYYYVQANQMYQTYVLELIDNRDGDLFSIGSIFFYTCLKPLWTGLMYYPYSINTILSIDTVFIEPYYQIYTDCVAASPLPNGLTVTSFGGIQGQFSSPSSLQKYNISCASNTVQAQVALSSNYCAFSFLFFFIHFSSLSSSEGFTLYRTGTNDILYQSYPYSDTNESITEQLYFCWNGESLDLVLFDFDEDAWPQHSSMSITQFFPTLPCPTNSSLLFRSSFDQLYPSRFTINLNYLIPRGSTWSYVYSSVPSRWYADEYDITSWSTGSLSLFPPSLTQLQLYRSTFIISNTTLITNAELAIRYTDGCNVYINGHEVFKDKIEGYALSTPSDVRSKITTTTFSTSSYSQLNYYVVVVPSFVLRSGTNSIAIFLVSRPGAPSLSTFDASLRLVSNVHHLSSEFFSVECNHIKSPLCSSILDVNHYSSYVGSHSNFSIHLIPKQYRYSFINEYSITNSYSYTHYLTNWSLYGRKDPLSSVWYLLHSVDDSDASSPYSVRRYSLFHVKEHYYDYQFRGFRNNDITNNTFIIPDILLYTSVFPIPKHPLNYGIDTVLEAYIAEPFPSLAPLEEGYLSFRCDAPLPKGLKLNPNNGVISGTPSERTLLASYTITAYDIMNNQSSYTFSMEISNCLEPKQLVFIRIKTDISIESMGYSLYQYTKDIEDEQHYVLLDSQSSFLSSTTTVFSYCLISSLYQLKLVDLTGNGWNDNAGYQIELDSGYLLASGSVPLMQNKTTFDVLFSTQLVVGKETKMYVYNSTKAIDENWKSSFNSYDPQWSEYSNTDQYQVFVHQPHYIRFLVDFQLYAQYTAINGYVQTEGGIVLYINGINIVVFNMPASYNETSSALEPHSFSDRYYFSYPIQLLSIHSRYILVAIEIHDYIHEEEPSEQYKTILFHISLLFMYGQCVPMTHSFSFLPSSPLTSGSLETLFDSSYFTNNIFNMVQENLTQFSVQALNQKGILFNSIHIHRVGMKPAPTKMTVIGQHDIYYDTITYLDKYMIPWKYYVNSYNEHMYIDVQRGLYGADHLSFIIEKSSSIRSINMPFISLQYCKLPEPICLGDIYYGPTGNLQYSYGSCPMNYQGFTKRLCQLSTLQIADFSDCRDIEISDFGYDQNRYTLVQNIYVNGIIPHYSGIVHSFLLLGSLPIGLQFDPSTGVFSGQPKEICAARQMTVMAINHSNNVTFTLYVEVRKGMCKEDGIWQSCEVNQVQFYSCSMLAHYIGTVTRSCYLGQEDGVWGEVHGYCMPLSVVILCVLIVVIIVVCFIYLCYFMKQKYVSSPVPPSSRNKSSSLKKEAKKSSMVIPSEKESSYSFFFSQQIHQSKLPVKGSIELPTYSIPSE